MRLKEMKTEQDWLAALEGSEERPALIFKHSTRCPISAGALEELNLYLEGEPNPDVDYWLVKVIESRPVSNRIAADTGVRHESPQVICLENRRAIWNASHGAITCEYLERSLRRQAP